MTADLVQFLRARLDEDQRAASSIAPGGYEPDEWRTEPSKSDRWAQVVAYSRTLGEPPEAAIRESDQPVAIVQSGRNEDFHIARHDPARVLAEVDAKRQIVDYVARELEDRGADNPWWYDDKLLPILRMLALPYTSHPDYRLEWAPDPA